MNLPEISSRFLPETQENKAGNWKVGQSGSEDVNSYLSRSAYQHTPNLSYMDITLPIDLPRNTIRKPRFQDLACGGGYVSGLARAQISHQSNARGLLDVPDMGVPSLSVPVRTC